jgi:hypothetical protein
MKKRSVNVFVYLYFPTLSRPISIHLTFIVDPTEELHLLGLLVDPATWIIFYKGI